jgi:hypothetical protein
LQFFSCVLSSSYPSYLPAACLCSRHFLSSWLLADLLSARHNKKHCFPSKNQLQYKAIESFR